jgi:hypothetical protein
VPRTVCPGPGRVPRPGVTATAGPSARGALDLQRRGSARADGSALRALCADPSFHDGAEG